MAAWRLRAYETFGFQPGSYSYADGRVELLSDLLDLLRRAWSDGDEVTVDRVVSYVTWAASQRTAENLQSAVDLAFLVPAFRDPQLCALLKARLPAEVFRERWRILMEEPSDRLLES